MRQGSRAAGTNPRALGTNPRAAHRKPRLAARKAADLYQRGLSACQIGERWGLSAKQAAGRIRAGGVHGVSWCPLCRTHEVV